MRPAYLVFSLLRFTAAATLFFGLAAFGADDPPPYVNGSIPGLITAGSGAITLKVVGVNFGSDAVVRWNGTPLPSTFVGSWEVDAAVPAGLIAEPKQVAITVFTRGLLTNTHVFSVVAAPVIMDVHIGNTDAALGQDTTMTVQGSGFVPGSTIVFAGTELATTVKSANLLTAAVSGRLVEQGGRYPVFVASPDLPNSNTYSYWLSFGLTAVSPTYVPAGSPDITISGAGYGFSSTITAKLSIFGVVHKLATNVSSPTAFTAVIPAACLTTAGVGVVSITDTVEGGGSLLLKFTIGDPPAAIRNVGPLPFIQGGPGFVMTVIGTRFAQGAVVQWNGTNLATAFQYNTQLAANVPASLLATAGEVRLRVVNPDGGASPEFTAEVQERFAIEGINPQTVFAGSDAFLLTVTGSGFKTGAAILLNGSQAPVTGYSSSHSLSARVEAPMLKGPGSVRVAVRNPDGALTQELRLIVEDTRPTITELIPSSAVAGSQPLTLTIMGRKFSPGASVSWGLYSLTTKFVDSTTLTATVPAAFLAAPSETGIAAVNPNGEGSSPAIFTVRNFVVTGILPSSVRAGSSDFTLTVTGEGFLGGSVLQWNSTRLVTTWRDERRLEAIVPAALIASPGAAAVSVLPAAGQASNAITFSIEVATPSISRLSPASIDAGSPGFTLGIDGADFARGATIWWQSTALATSWESPSRLTGSVPAALIASSGSIEIKACNTSTNCSSAAVFTVTEPGAPTFTSVMPSSVTAGAPSVLLTLAGSRFTPGSTVRWNGSPLQTAFVNSAQLVAVADASLIASPGTASIAVVNPGGVTSAALTFTINPPIPTYSAAGIVNAASSGALIAPGSLISIYGFNLATST
jgi:hypothetical protein